MAVSGVFWSFAFILLTFVVGLVLPAPDWAFRHNFMRDVYANVIEGMLGAKAPSYAKVLEYDRQIRQTTLPNVKLYLRPDEANYNNPSVVLRSFFLSHFRSIGVSTFRRGCQTLFGSSSLFPAHQP